MKENEICELYILNGDQEAGCWSRCWSARAVLEGARGRTRGGPVDSAAPAGARRRRHCSRVARRSLDGTAVHRLHSASTPERVHRLEI